MSNWGLLYEQGRCKAYGIPWTEEEAFAVSQLKIPAEYVRQGCLTIEDYEKAAGLRKKEEETTGKVALAHLKKDQLVLLCQKHGINVTDEATRGSMIEVLTNAGVPRSVPIEDVTQTSD